MANNVTTKSFFQGLIDENNDDKRYEAYRSTLPDNQRNTKDPDYEQGGKYRSRRYWELGGKPKDFNEAKNRKMFSLEGDGFYHARSVAYNRDKDEYEFMKAPNHPTLKYELDWYNGDKDGAPEFRSQYDLDKSGKYYRYVRKTPIPMPQEENKTDDIPTGRAFWKGLTY